MKLNLVQISMFIICVTFFINEKMGAPDQGDDNDNNNQSEGGTNGDNGNDNGGDDNGNGEEQDTTKQVSGLDPEQKLFCAARILSSFTTFSQLVSRIIHTISEFGTCQGVTICAIPIVQSISSLTEFSISIMKVVRDCNHTDSDCLRGVAMLVSGIVQPVKQLLAIIHIVLGNYQDKGSEIVDTALLSVQWRFYQLYRGAFNVWGMCRKNTDPKDEIIDQLAEITLESPAEPESVNYEQPDLLRTPEKQFENLYYKSWNQGMMFNILENTPNGEKIKKIREGVIDSTLSSPASKPNFQYAKEDMSLEMKLLPRNIPKRYEEIRIASKINTAFYYKAAKRTNIKESRDKTAELGELYTKQVLKVSEKEKNIGKLLYNGQPRKHICLTPIQQDALVKVINTQIEALAN